MKSLKRLLAQTAEDFKAFLERPGHDAVTARKALKQAVELFADAQVEIGTLEVRIRALEDEAQAAIRGDLDARRGLFPYVDAIERFNLYLQTKPELATTLEPIMRQLEIWQLKVNPGIRERLTGTTDLPSPSTGWNRVPVLSQADAQSMVGPRE